jgi:AraC family transcriptional regulator of arabinose operon
MKEHPALFHGDIVTSNRVIYTPSDFARLSLTYLQEAGRLQARKPHESRRSGLDSYLFFMVESGTGTLEYEGQTHRLRAGDCVFIDCHRNYTHRTSDDLWALKWIHFSGANMPEIYGRYLERGGQPHFRPASPAAYEEIWENMFQIMSAPDHIRDMKINAELSRLLTLLMEESWHPEYRKAGMKKNSLQPVRTYIEKNYAERITLDLLSGTFYINKFYLTRMFREQFGISVNSYIEQVRITRAKQLLRFTDQSVEEIGAAVGIHDPAYFSRIFRKVEKVSPKVYREQWIS